MLLNRAKRWIDGLRFPGLLVLSLIVLIADLAVPDVIPFVDEILLACLTALFARWRKRGSEKKDPGEEPGSENTENQP